MSLAFAIPSLPSATIAGRAERFPVGRIFCVGRNYAAHAKEMGGNPEREAPFFFTKFPQALVAGGGNVPYPPSTSSYHYEGELVVAIGPNGIFGYAAGLDMTRRDLQTAAKDAGRPWDTAKNFAHAAPIGTIRPVEAHGHVERGGLRLTLNGELKQQGDITDMIWNTQEIIEALGRFERLLPGDLIYTGTPAGVGPAKIGDAIRVEIDGLEPLDVTIVAAGG